MTEAERKTQPEAQKTIAIEKEKKTQTSIRLETENKRCGKDQRNGSSRGRETGLDMDADLEREANEDKESQKAR